MLLAGGGAVGVAAAGLFNAGFLGGAGLLELVARGDPKEMVDDHIAIAGAVGTT
tara:strand:+ start:149 stop:310 length:162 start_codon:yes stop_codon:yes gene_type:complete